MNGKAGRHRDVPAFSFAGTLLMTDPWGMLTAVSDDRLALLFHLASFIITNIQVAIPRFVFCIQGDGRHGFVDWKPA
jgi:hypothetical protein